VWELECNECIYIYFTHCGRGSYCQGLKSNRKDGGKCGKFI
jgi:hypothetical protein